MLCLTNQIHFGPGEDDLADVLDAVLDMAAEWKSLGAALRIRHGELEAFFKKNHTDPNGCLIDVLLAWLKLNYDTKKFGQPSWRVLCQAIQKPAGGNNPALARKIAEKHSKPKVVLYVVDYQYMDAVVTLNN